MEIICHQRKKLIVCVNTLSQLCHLLVPSTNIKPHLPPAHCLQVQCVSLNTEDKSPFSHLLCLLVRKETDIFHVAIDVKKYKEGKGKENVGKEAASDKVTFQQRIKVKGRSKLRRTWIQTLTTELKTVLSQVAALSRMREKRVTGGEVRVHSCGSHSPFSSGRDGFFSLREMGSCWRQRNGVIWIVKRVTMAAEEARVKAQQGGSFCS